MFSLSAHSSTRKVPQHRKSANDLKLQRRSRSRQDLVASPSSTDSRITTCSAISNSNVSSANTIKARVGTDTLLQPAHVIVEGEAWKSNNNVNDDASSLKERVSSFLFDDLSVMTDFCYSPVPHPNRQLRLRHGINN